jgi:hypothetical protein
LVISAPSPTGRARRRTWAPEAASRLTDTPVGACRDLHRQGAIRYLRLCKPRVRRAFRSDDNRVASARLTGIECPGAEGGEHAG